MNTAYEDESSVIRIPWKVLVVDCIKIHVVLLMCDDWHIYMNIYDITSVGIVVMGWRGGGGGKMHQYMHCRIYMS